MKAFPAPTNLYEKGMDLRDYFAAKAMQGFLAADPSILADDIRLLTKTAYKIADAMMEARK
jgi:hypothetical protein